RRLALGTVVCNFGFYVDRPGRAMSWLVPLCEDKDDFYDFDAARNHLVRRRTRCIIRLGDKVTVQVAKVDTFKKQVDFRMVAEERFRAKQTRAVQIHRPHTAPARSGGGASKPVRRD